MTSTVTAHSNQEDNREEGTEKKGEERYLEWVIVAAVSGYGTRWRWVVTGVH